MEGAFCQVDSASDLSVFEAVVVPVGITSDKKPERIDLKRKWNINRRG
jgi:phosphoserine phosphatase